MLADDDDGVAIKQMFYGPPLILLQPRPAVKHFSLKIHVETPRRGVSALPSGGVSTHQPCPALQPCSLHGLAGCFAVVNDRFEGFDCLGDVVEAPDVAPDRRTARPTLYNLSHHLQRCFKSA